MLTLTSLFSSKTTAFCEGEKQHIVHIKKAPQMCSKCDEDRQGGFKNPVLMTYQRKSNGSGKFSSLEFPISRSQPSTISNVSESSMPNFVYRRKKLHTDLVIVSTTQVSANTRATDGCFSAVSSEVPSTDVKDKHIVSQKEHTNEVGGAADAPPVVCNIDQLPLKSGSLIGSSVGEEHASEEVPKNDMLQIIDVPSANDCCSSSKSNVDLGSDTTKIDTDDTGECSSSDMLVMEAMGEDLSEKDFCISILRSNGLLGGAWPVRPCVSAEQDTTCETSCSRSCKICGHFETSLCLLICDHCEEAFHLSCCNPRVKKKSIGEWFCHSCLKKKCKILKETSTKNSLNLSIERDNSYRNSTPIAFMLTDTEPYITGVRVSKGFQAEVPDWSGPVTNGVDEIGESLEMDPSESIISHGWISNKSSRVSSIGNWLQCREVIDGLGDGLDGTICGKWRRAPLFEVQTDDWDCFHSVLWDPTHADCAAPQELETDQVLKQLKYIEMLRPRLAAKRRKLVSVESGVSSNPKMDVKNI